MGDNVGKTKSALGELMDRFEQSDADLKEFVVVYSHGGRRRVLRVKATDGTNAAERLLSAYLTGRIYGPEELEERP